MRYKLMFAAGAVTCSLIATLAAPDAAVPVPPAAPADAPATTTLRVLRTREFRERFEPGTDKQRVMLSPTPGVGMGDWLVFDLSLEGLPSTSRIVDVEMTSASAKDDLGNDLIGPLVKLCADDPKEFATRYVQPGEQGPTIRWLIAAPQRAAKSIDATLLVRVRVASGLDTLTLRPTGDWRRLEHPSMDGLKAEYRRSSIGTLGPYLNVRPRGAETLIYGLSPRPPQFRGRAAPSGRDSFGASFLLAKDTPEDAEVQVSILSGIQTYEATLTLKAHDLP